MNYLRLDLKVCEGCGTLWLRGAVADGVYCRGCAQTVSNLPQPRFKNPGGRPQSRSRRMGCAAARSTAQTAANRAGGAR